MRIRCDVFAIALFMIAVSGCTPSLKLAKRFFGISVDSMRHRAEGRFSTVCRLPYHDCFVKTLSILKNMKADVFVQSEKDYSIGASHFNVVFSKCLDATDAGTFFDPISPSATRIDVVSYNRGLSQFLSEELSAKLKMQILPDRSSKGGAHGG